MAVERTIAMVRVVIAAMTLMAAWLDPSEAGLFSDLTVALLLAYAVWAVVLAVLVGANPPRVIERAALIRDKVTLPAGYAALWSGQYEGTARVRARLGHIIPLTLLLVFMLLYLDLSYERAKQEGRLSSRADLQEAIVHGAARRLRPKFMTVATTFLGFIPIMWATGTGSDVWKRIAAPMIGGIFTSFLLELIVYPAIYEIWKWRADARHFAAHKPPRGYNPPL